MILKPLCCAKVPPKYHPSILQTDSSCSPSLSPGPLTFQRKWSSVHNVTPARFSHSRCRWKCSQILHKSRRDPSYTPSLLDASSWISRTLRGGTFPLRQRRSSSILASGINSPVDTPRLLLWRALTRRNCCLLTKSPSKPSPTLYKPSKALSMNRSMHGVLDLRRGLQGRVVPGLQGGL